MQQQFNNNIPMTSAALPPRVNRPSTAPSTKPNQSRVVVPPPSNFIAAPVTNTTTTTTATVFDVNPKSRPSSAQVVVTRAFATTNNNNNIRPSSAAFSTRPSSGGTARSIATTTAAQNHHHHHSTSAAHQGVTMSTRNAAVASVKGDILLLQRTIDKINSNNNNGITTTTSSGTLGKNNNNNNNNNNLFPQKDGLFEVEQILTNEFPPLLPGDEVLAADMHAKLLELFVQRLNIGCLDVLAKLDPDCVEGISLVSRTAGINTLLQKISTGFVGGRTGGVVEDGEDDETIYHRNGTSSSSASKTNNNNNNKNGSNLFTMMMNTRKPHQHVQTQTVSIGGLSAAEMTDFQFLLKEQREIQSQMKQTLNAGSVTANNNNNMMVNGNLVPPIGNVTSSSTAVTTTTTTSARGGSAQVRHLREQLEEANKSLAEMKSEASSLQSKLSRSETQRLALDRELKDLEQQYQKLLATTTTTTNNRAGSIAKSSNHPSRNNTTRNSPSASITMMNNNNNGNNDDENSTSDGIINNNNTNSQEFFNNNNNKSSRGGAGAGAGGVNNNNNNSSSSALDQQIVMMNKMTPEAAYAAAVGATVGFFRLEPDILSQVGLDSMLNDSPRFVPERQYCEQIHAKVSSAISEILSQIVADGGFSSENAGGNLFGSAVNRLVANNSVRPLISKGTGSGSGGSGGAGGGLGSKKDKNENSPEALAAKIGAMWWILEKQNATVQAMQLLLVQQHDRIEKATNDHEALDKRTKRMISVLEEKLGHAKSVVQRLMEENEMLQHNSNSNNSNNNDRDSPSSGDDNNGNNNRNNNNLGRSSRNNNNNVHGPNVRSANDDPTPEETRKSYERNELRLQRRILELEHTTSESHAFVEQAKLNAAATHRELQSFKAKCQRLEKELEAKRASEEKAVAEATKLREEREGNKKDLRERHITATEAEQKVNRLDVELHISQNIVADLRRREIQLEKNSQEAKNCQDILKQKMLAERDSHSREIARLREENRAARHEVVVANQILADERQKAVANEREIERLRGLDLQLEALQQNFANYAGAKQAQKEAHDEEERALQACVELIGQDVFALPFGEDQGDEEVELLLRRLKDAEESMAAEERTRDTLRNTVVGFRDERTGRKQLASLMQRRYNAIQIFACQQRLRQLQLEEKLQETLVHNDEHRVQYEGAMVELSHARSHEQALLQRNSELEQQRRETLKNKDIADGEVKALRQTIQRMRIANEEQEAAIVELGTKLKRKELAEEKSTMNGTPSSGGGGAAAAADSLNGSLTTKSKKGLGGFLVNK